MAAKKRIRRSDVGPNVAAIGSGFVQQFAQGLADAQAITQIAAPIAGGGDPLHMRLARPSAGNVIFVELEQQIALTAWEGGDEIFYELLVSVDEGANWQSIGGPSFDYPAALLTTGEPDIFADQIQYARMVSSIDVDSIVGDGPTLICEARVQRDGSATPAVTVVGGLLRMSEQAPIAAAPAP
jgi:hypothetical protein